MGTNRPEPLFAKQKQEMPGRTAAMKPVPDHGDALWLQIVAIACTAAKSRMARDLRDLRRC